jgi:hypothetical protein
MGKVESPISTGRIASVFSLFEKRYICELMSGVSPTIAEKIIEKE